MANESTYETRFRGDYGVAFGAGVIGALAMTVLMAIGRALGFNLMNLEMMLGTMLTAEPGPGAWTLGFIWHLLNGGVFALVYAAVFRSVGRSGAGPGAAYGVLHWVAGGALLALLPVLNPLIPQAIASPGWYALGLNFGSVLTWFLVHLAFGGIVGAIYLRSAVVAMSGRDARERPETRRAA